MNLITQMMIGIVCLILLSNKVDAVLKVKNLPATIIRGDSSELDRPEGVAYSNSGKYIAAANALVDKITFYKRVGNDGAVYQTVPAFSIKGKVSELNYPHDIAFSPDDQHLAVANRLGNSITIYRKNTFNDRYHNKPIARIQGPSSGIMLPDAVKYSPTDNAIAVANLGNNTISFYHYSGNVYEQYPYQIIHDSNNMLSVPDGLDFSRDGELLATTSHDTHSVLIYQKIPNSDGLYTSEPVEIIKGPETNLTYPHSLSFHPTKEYLLVSSSQGRKNINIFQLKSNSFPRYDSKPFLSLEITEMYEESTIHLLEQLHQEGGCKGVSFSSDGTSFAVTQNLCEDLLKLPYSVGVLLVYPIDK